MRVAIASDHAGFGLKSHLKAVLRSDGYEVIDLGTDGEEAVDYPAYCAAVARAVVRGDAERGIVLGGSGQGEQMAANAVAGARAALCNDLYTACMARRHNDANILSMGGRIVAPGLADEIVELFLATPFEGGRHQKRVDQLEQLATMAGDPTAQDALLESLVPGLPGRSRAGAQTDGASTQEAEPIGEASN